MYSCKIQRTQGNKKTIYTYSVLIGLFVCGENLLLHIRLLLIDPLYFAHILSDKCAVKCI